MPCRHSSDADWFAMHHRCPDATGFPRLYPGYTFAFPPLPGLLRCCLLSPCAGTSLIPLALPRTNHDPMLTGSACASTALIPAGLCCSGATPMPAGSPCASAAPSRCCPDVGRLTMGRCYPDAGRPALRHCSPMPPAFLARPCCASGIYPLFSGCFTCYPPVLALPQCQRSHAAPVLP